MFCNILLEMPNNLIITASKPDEKISRHLPTFELLEREIENYPHVFVLSDTTDHLPNSLSTYFL